MANPDPVTDRPTNGAEAQPPIRGTDDDDSEDWRGRAPHHFYGGGGGGGGRRGQSTTLQWVIGIGSLAILVLMLTGGIDSIVEWQLGPMDRDMVAQTNTLAQHDGRLQDLESFENLHKPSPTHADAIKDLRAFQLGMPKVLKEELAPLKAAFKEELADLLEQFHREMDLLSVAIAAVDDRVDQLAWGKSDLTQMVDADKVNEARIDEVLTLFSARLAEILRRIAAIEDHIDRELEAERR